MLFARKKQTDAISFTAELLNATNSRLLVMARGSGELLFMNTSAAALFDRDITGGPSLAPRLLSPQLLSALAGHCKHWTKDDSGLPPKVQDSSGTLHTPEIAPIVWPDGTPALLITLWEEQPSAANVRELYDMAYQDALTALPNRAKLKKRFEELFPAADDSRFGAVALFDMDYFKQVNDTYGHNTGDVLLQRLAQYLQAIPEFRGNLYRLGGDEFIFLFGEGHCLPEREAEVRRRYEDLLQQAFSSYTMPGVEQECTISMGLSYFPAHGTTLSELLRKADIALYKAKELGRNKLVVFEEWYDNLHAFSDYYISSRPILAMSGATYGYELADSSPQAQANPNTLNFNLEEYNRVFSALEPSDLDNELRYFVRYGRQLDSPLALSVLPREKFVILLPPAVRPEELTRYRALQKKGYLLAADAASATEELMSMADYIRISTDAPARMSELMLKYPQKRFIAIQVDSLTAFERAKKAGILFYQGRYLSQPVAVKTGKDLTPLKSNYLRLLLLTSSCHAVDFAQISDIISSDVALTYKLLRLLNSAAAALRNRMTSVSMAVTYLGEEKLKKWIVLLTLRGLMADQPMEVLRISLIRARFGELLAPAISPTWNPDQVYLCGMLSLLHIALETTQEQLLEELFLSDDIKSSLLTREGPFSGLLEFFAHYEYANWDGVASFVQLHNVDRTMLYDCYISAVEWYNALTEPNELTASPS